MVLSCERNGSKSLTTTSELLGTTTAACDNIVMINDETTEAINPVFSPVDALNQTHISVVADNDDSFAAERKGSSFSGNVANPGVVDVEERSNSGIVSMTGSQELKVKKNFDQVLRHWFRKECCVMFIDIAVIWRQWLLWLAESLNKIAVANVLVADYSNHFLHEEENITSNETAKESQVVNETKGKPGAFPATKSFLFPSSHQNSNATSEVPQERNPGSAGDGTTIASTTVVSTSSGGNTISSGELKARVEADLVRDYRRNYQLYQSISEQLSYIEDLLVGLPYTLAGDCFKEIAMAFVLRTVFLRGLITTTKAENILLPANGDVVETMGDDDVRDFHFCYVDGYTAISANLNLCLLLLAEFFVHLKTSNRCGQELLRELGSYLFVLDAEEDEDHHVDSESTTAEAGVEQQVEGKQQDKSLKVENVKFPLISNQRNNKATSTPKTTTSKKSSTSKTKMQQRKLLMDTVFLNENVVSKEDSTTEQHGSIINKETNIEKSNSDLYEAELALIESIIEKECVCVENFVLAYRSIRRQKFITEQFLKKKCQIFATSPDQQRKQDSEKSLKQEVGQQQEVRKDDFFLSRASPEETLERRFS